MVHQCLLPVCVCGCVLQNQNMQELKTRVEELRMEKEYQLRLSDSRYNEKIKELSDTFILEIQALKAKNQVE